MIVYAARIVTKPELCAHSGPLYMERHAGVRIWLNCSKNLSRHTSHDAVGRLISRIMISIHFGQSACVACCVNHERGGDDHIVQARKFGSIIVVNTVLCPPKVKLHPRAQTVIYELFLELQSVHSRIWTVERPEQVV